MESTFTSANDTSSDASHVPESTLPHSQQDASAAGSEADAGSAAHELVQRAARSAHDAVDAVASRIESLVDGVGTDRLSQVRDDWMGATRDAIAARPVAAIGIALLVGIGIASLRSSRHR